MRTTHQSESTVVLCVCVCVCVWSCRAFVDCWQGFYRQLPLPATIVELSFDADLQNLNSRKCNESVIVLFASVSWYLQVQTRMPSCAWMLDLRGRKSADDQCFQLQMCEQQRGCVCGFALSHWAHNELFVVGSFKLNDCLKSCFVVGEVKISNSNNNKTTTAKPFGLRNLFSYAPSIWY